MFQGTWTILSGPARHPTWRCAVPAFDVAEPMCSACCHSTLHETCESHESLTACLAPEQHSTSTQTFHSPSMPLKSPADFQGLEVWKHLSMPCSRFSRAFVRGPGLRMKSATMTVPSGLHSRASCCTNLLQVGKGGGRRGGEGGGKGGRCQERAQARWPVSVVRNGHTLQLLCQGL